MPANKHALLRFKTIDKCLQNRFRKWTLEDLIDACSDALYEYEGIDKGVSRRTVQADIQLMRSDKLGYNAPIVVEQKKYYTYEDPDYSITNIPISEQDMSKLAEAVEMLRQFKGFSHFRELDSMVQKLEDHVHATTTKEGPVIDFEKNEQLRGLEHLDTLYQAIINKKWIKLTYQSFKAREPQTFDFQGWLLKEFRNRWFIIGQRDGATEVQNLALDRIQAVEVLDRFFHQLKPFNASDWFRDVIGVTVSRNLRPEAVQLFIPKVHAQYVLTKPLHHSQKVVQTDEYGTTISLHVQHNFELEKELLALGEQVRVIAPERLKRAIRERHHAAGDLYRTELSDETLQSTAQQLEHRGTALLPSVFTQREVRRIRRKFDRYFAEEQAPAAGLRQLLIKMPELAEMLFNNSLKRIISSIDPQAQLVKAIYFDKHTNANWYVTWHQDQTINLKQKKATKGFSGWTEKEGVISVIPPIEVLRNTFALRIHLSNTTTANGAVRVVPGSHNKQLSDAEIQLITKNSIPQECELPAGGVHLMKPLVLHCSAKSTQEKRRQVIHLEFCSDALPNGLEFAEAMQPLL